MSNVRRALVSVSDKRGVIAFGTALQRQGVEIWSTGGTFRELVQADIQATEVAAKTEFPEIMGGRVKTLHPKIHGGLLGRRGVDDATMAEHGIEPIDLLVVNLYPFEETISRPDATLAEAIENIDIGGPAMIRAAAKNHDGVIVVVDPEDYDGILDAIAGNGITSTLRRQLAAKAFAHTASYDTAITRYLSAQDEGDSLSERMLYAGTRIDTLRYGENPHQQAAFYRDQAPVGGSLAAASQRQGKALSYNNIADGDAALECVRQFDDPACVIVKHANPCGVAVRDTALTAYDAAFRTDPTSAFGGIIAFNREVDGDTAQTIIERQFVEVVIAPSFSDAALEAMSTKKNVRVLSTGPAETISGQRLEYKKVSGGMLVQTADGGQVSESDLKVVTERTPDANELRDLLFAWRVAKFVKSNAIVFCKDRMTIGVGAGQMSRVYSTKIAAIKAGDEDLEVAGSVLASDAFFPFRDGIDTAAEHGIAAVIQPGGSMRDDEVIAAANEHGLAMVFTGMRHFRH